MNEHEIRQRTREQEAFERNRSESYGSANTLNRLDAPNINGNMKPLPSSPSPSLLKETLGHADGYSGEGNGSSGTAAQCRELTVHELLARHADDYREAARRLESRALELDALARSIPQSIDYSASRCLKALLNADVHRLSLLGHL